MILLIGQFLILSVVIVIAATALTHMADHIAKLTSLGHSLAGLILLAAATSIPELSVGWASIRIDAADLSVGELLGSCLWNLLLLAILDISTKSKGRMFSRSSAAHALIATVGVLLASIAILGLVLEEDVVLLRASPFSWSMLFAYVLCLRLVFKDHRSTTEDEVTEAIRRDRWKLVRAIFGYLICVGVIFIVAPKLAVVADEIAHESGLGGTFVGVTFVALITSLPEAVTTWAAIRIGQIDMAVANIFGSNAFNLTILAAVDFATPLSLLHIASEVHVVTATAVILVTAVALLGILYRAEKKFLLLEPDAFVVILLLIGTLWLVYRNRV